MTTVDFYTHILSAVVFAMLIYVLLKQRKKLDFLRSAFRSLVQDNKNNQPQLLKLASLDEHIAFMADMCGCVFENSAGKTKQLYAMKLGPMVQVCMAIKPRLWRMGWNEQKILEVEVICGQGVSESQLKTYNNEIGAAFRPGIAVKLKEYKNLS